MDGRFQPLPAIPSTRVATAPIFLGVVLLGLGIWCGGGGGNARQLGPTSQGEGLFLLTILRRSLILPSAVLPGRKGLGEAAPFERNV